MAFPPTNISALVMNMKVVQEAAESAGGNKLMPVVLMLGAIQVSKTIGRFF